MKLAALVGAMESIAPPALAEPWDNTGLLVGSADDDLPGRVLLTIDLTEGVLADASAGGARAAIIAYHPPIWKPINRLSGDTARGRLLLVAVRSGAAIYSPHTALDAAEGGLADWLTDGVIDPGQGSTGDRRALTPHPQRRSTEEVKLVTFVPEAAAGQVRDALATAGAGLIGAYSVCSFATPGVGTFLGGPGSNPAVGAAGRLEEARELRLEMVCSRQALAIALETLSRFHPHEEPAVDVYELLPRPRRRVGAGRRVLLDRPATIAEIAGRLKRHLGVPLVHLAGGPASRPVTRIGVCPGSGSGLVSAALADGCELFVTGEMKHHDTLDAVQRGLAVITAGHTSTERGYLPVLARRLSAALPGVRVDVSAADRPLSEPL